MSYLDDKLISKEVEKELLKRKEERELNPVDFKSYIEKLSRKRKAEPMTPSFKVLRLWLTTQSEVRKDISKLVYHDRVMMMFNDKSVKYNLIFTLSQEYVMYLMALNPRVKVEPFYASLVTDSSGNTGNSNTTQVSDIFTRQTKTVKVNYGIPKKKIVLFGLRVERLRNPRHLNYIDLVVKPFATYRRLLKFDGKFVSAHDLIDKLLKLNKKVFEETTMDSKKSRDGKEDEKSEENSKKEVRKNTSDLKNLKSNLLEIRDSINEFSVLQLDYLHQWKMSSHGVVFSVSPVRFYDLRNKNVEQEPRLLNPWLAKVFSKWLD